MADFTLQEILNVTGGELLQFAGQAGMEDPSSFVVHGVSTDTRKIEKGNLFLALIGENFDGNRYAMDAAERGAPALLLSTMDHAPKDIPVVLVPDTKDSLLKLAEYYRKRLGCKVIAVTGSVGKTSTRQMITSSLSKACQVHATEKNMNNEIGLSQTILEAPENTEVMVLEMGMRGRGQISQLTHIAHPDVAVITNIGVAHQELLGSREQILLAKLEVQECLPEGGILILPYADEMLQKAVREGLIRKDIRIAYTSTEDVSFPDFACGTAVSGEGRFEDDRLCFSARAGFETQTDFTLRLKAVGLHHIGNALAGLLCGLYMGIDPETITLGVNAFAQEGHRERLVTVEGIHFLDDAYNAGPESMASAFVSLRRLAQEGKAYACISDMLELGDVAFEKHLEIGNKAAEVGLDGVFVMGDYQDTVRRGVTSVSPDLPVYCFDDKTSMTEKLAQVVRPGDFVLLKASHSFEMYTILEEYGSIVRGGNEP